MLVRSHRRKFPLEEFESLTNSMRISVIRLCVLLRLAVVLHRSRSNNSLPKIHVSTNKDKITLDFPADWLDKYPLTLVDLCTEQSFLQLTDIKLTFN